ncbi:MAG: hypothetical protein KC656_12720, partial [Myxococcales bacterium]|nr:hypothetical protein [Myxococcales bacterium]
MRALFLLALGTLSTTALAGSELQLKSSMPVNLYIDGEEAGTVQPLEALRVDIEAGVHNLKIKGLLGKDLYDRDLIFDDDTRTELIWQRKELRLGSVAKLDPNRPKEEVVEEDLGYESAEEVAEAGEIENPPPVDVEHPEEVAAAPPAPSERPPLERP